MSLQFRLQVETRTQAGQRMTSANTESPGFPKEKFLVEAQPQPEMFGSSEKPHVYVSTFYPGTLDADQAAAVEVHAGDEATASFSLTRSRTFTVKGRVFGCLAPTIPKSSTQMDSNSVPVR